ncbi:RING finger protein, putative [Perkinsus marinus ATCC 50983]|uniref:RING finger protein, putative n=1 Tax=Perkinsus marinus (strain ATCC 50983 / TXsc) TaxID=423536 RepID=C5KUW7_PERM5|nr:RING finger protein, putative [Perkinsus marinus ATCC 50983]EER11683.1 RING finger protein, putative [Perkinsus marinus ATCC 50983]|eukprot:XP_002779888.1 RING finger protein, putative [Perkinsus marinus ATCC 50983]
MSVDHVRLAQLRKNLSSKSAIIAALGELSEMANDSETIKDAAFVEVCHRAFTVLNTRFSAAVYWQAGLELFLNMQFTCGRADVTLPDCDEWAARALEESDEESKAKAKDRVRAAVRSTSASGGGHQQQQQLLDLLGINLDNLQAVMADVGGDQGAPPASRDARNELRMVTLEEDELCVMCQEEMKQGSKAKKMPECGHVFHDHCIMEWLERHNTCPLCRNDDLQTEKKAFDDIAEKVRLSRKAERTSGLYA